MLRVAVPNKGGMAEPAAQMLREAGYRQRDNTRDLVLVDGPSGMEFYYLRPRDIAVYVGEGTVDVGITGRDLLLDSGAPADEELALGFAASRFRFAAPPGTFERPDDPIAELAGRRIATSYAGVLDAFLARHDIRAQVTRLEGAVETAVRLGVADLVADVVETGSTLRQAGLEIVGAPILESEAVLIRSRRADGVRLEAMVRRLQGVLVARSYVLMDYDIPEERLGEATQVAPGFEGATVSPLHRAGWVAVRVMVPRAKAQQLMDDLWAIGARAILVTDIHACRL